VVEKSAQRLDFPVDGQIRLLQRAIRHADAKSVVANKRVLVRNAFPEASKGCALPVELEVAHPPRRSDDR
jgi:hypothetical protein